jgi:DNA-binding transcriptional regulator LsrR (DeoR family)
MSSKSIIKLVCDLYKRQLIIKEIAIKININRRTVSRYLQKAQELGWCKYERYSTQFKPIIQLNLEGKYLNEFKSMEIAMKETGATNITNVCKGRSKSSGGFRWIYKEEYEKL